MEHALRGTVNAALFLPSGKIVFATDSRCTSATPTGSSWHSDLHSKLQILGSFFILPAGSALFGNLVISWLRRAEDLDRDLMKFVRSFESAIAYVKRSKEWNEHIKAMKMKLDNYSFIIGSVVVQRGSLSFKEKEFVVIDSAAGFMGGPTKTKFAVAGCPTAAKVVKEVIESFDWSEKKAEYVAGGGGGDFNTNRWLEIEQFYAESLIVLAFGKSYAASASVGGPIEFSSVVPFMIGGTIKLAQVHDFFIPELYWTMHSIPVEGLVGEPLEVPGYFLKEGETKFLNQISKLAYSDDVETMTTTRVVEYDGNSVILYDRTSMMRLLFPVDPVVV